MRRALITLLVVIPLGGALCPRGPSTDPVSPTDPDPADPGPCTTCAPPPPDPTEPPPPDPTEPPPPDPGPSFPDWPNSASNKNSDPWLAAHHDDIERLHPRVLVLLYDNGMQLADANAMLDDVISGFEEGSRSHGGNSAPQLLYERARDIVDLRDQSPPADWSLPNSTRYPRKPPDADGKLRFDYARLFGAGVGHDIGMGGDLCALVNAGAIHEVWVMAAGDDAAMAEVLELKQRYTDTGAKVAGAFDRCSGNGCFEEDVPVCGRSLRIGSINTRRGPGCYLHSQGHGMEGTALRGAVPQMSKWFMPFARFDLDTRYGAPHRLLYELGCSDTNNDGAPDPPCLRYPAQGYASLVDRSNTFTINHWDGACGNVHFPPNAVWHYDTDNDVSVLSSCRTFGRGDVLEPVDATLWRDNELIAGDCGGGYLIWWMQNMPAHSSGMRYADGSTMKSVWPFLFY